MLKKLAMSEKIISLRMADKSPIRDDQGTLQDEIKLRQNDFSSVTIPKSKRLVDSVVGKSLKINHHEEPDNFGFVGCVGGFGVENGHEKPVRLEFRGISPGETFEVCGIVVDASETV